MMSQRRSQVGGHIPTSIPQVAWSPDGSQLAGGSEDGIVYLWDAVDGTLLQQLTGHHGKIMCVAWSPDGSHLASCGVSDSGGELFVWDPRAWRVCSMIAEHPRMIHAVAWASDSLLISGGGDGKLRWWNVESGELLLALDAHYGTVMSLGKARMGRSWRLQR